MNNCIVCDNAQHTLIFKKSNYEVVRCNKCGMVHIEPMPTLEETIGYYQSYGQAQYTEEYIKQNINKTYVEGRFEFYKNLLLKYYNEGSSVLDIGCHCAEFLKVLKNANFDVYGLEVSKSISKAVEENLNIPVYNVDISKLSTDQKFDVISALSVLEHTPNPDIMIKKIYNLLKDDGYLLLEVPNVDSYESQAVLYFFSQTLNYWFHPTPPIHLYEFNKVTINSFLNKYGFQIIETGTAQPFEYDGDTIYPEGYYINREGLSLINLESEKTNLLNIITQNRNKYKNTIQIDKEVLAHIGKRLINTLFKEIAPFSKAADNRTGIWLLAKKIKEKNEINLNELNNIEALIETVGEGLNYVKITLEKNDLNNSAAVFNDIVLAICKLEELTNKIFMNPNIELIKAMQDLINLINKFKNYYNCNELKKLKEEVENLIKSYYIWSKCIKKIISDFFM
ncbi:class I SAM-dependent methyltransferase [Clostridium thailandense]|uniref:class I SAM-dependent methyltransferase n=1 Tax=Clostridium thailandense TaxID=2794346 RepID=UPI0039895340